MKKIKTEWDKILKNLEPVKPRAITKTLAKQNITKKNNTPALNLSCKQIKESIKGLTLLVNLGDNSVKKELNELKKLLKTQNCK
jgi:hypothetical protein